MKFVTAHLDEIGESYWQHLGHAFGFAVTMVLGGIACLIHAFFPFWCVKAGSNSIRDLHDRMVVNRGSLSQAVAAGASDADEIA